MASGFSIFPKLQIFPKAFQLFRFRDCYLSGILDQMGCSACKPASRSNWVYVYVDLISQHTALLGTSTEDTIWKPILVMTTPDHRGYNRFRHWCTGYGGFSETEPEDNQLAKN